MWLVATDLDSSHWTSPSWQKVLLDSTANTHVSACLSSLPRDKSLTILSFLRLAAMKQGPATWASCLPLHGQMCATVNGWISSYSRG